VFISVTFADVQCPFSSGTCVQLSLSSVSGSTTAITVAGTGNSSNPIYFYFLDPQGNVIKPADIFPAIRSQTYSFADLGFPATLPVPGTYIVFAGSAALSPPPISDFNSLKNWFGSSGDYGYHNLDSIASLPPPAILHIVNLVVNGNGGTAVPSNFNVHVKSAGADILGSPASGVAAPGAPYSLSAGIYSISEDPNTSYIQTFTGDCNSSGNITLAPGDNKICTVVNTDIPVPAPVIVSNGEGGGVYNYIPTAIVPLIGILETPAPLALPGGSGSVIYNYTVWNVGGQQSLTNVTVTDDKCAPVSRVSGDVNNNGKLDPGENWQYHCDNTISTSTTDTAIATGYSDDSYHQAAIATALATVVVTQIPNLPDTGLAPKIGLFPPLINVVKVPSRLTPFPVGGGDITYVYIVTNPGVIAMHDVAVTDDKCAPVYRTSPDVNDNSLLDPGETWVYICQTNISVSTRNVVTAKGSANGFTALGYAFANVLVSATSTSPANFPNTGTTAVSEGQVKGITADLQEGSSGNNVTTLQQFLISQNSGPASQALAEAGTTSYFGILTRAALAEFQAKAGISPALGNFGPITQAYLNAH